MKLIKYAIALLSFLLVSNSFAQDFLYQNLKIAKHEKKNSSVKYKLKEKLFGGPNPELGIEDVDLDVPAYVFSNYDLPNSTGNYDGLPACKKNKTREVVRDEDAFRSLDVVVYQFGKDDKKAKVYNKAASTQAVIPYIEGALENPFRPKNDDAQTIIRGLGIECLPTRVESVKINGKNAFRYFEGKLAWKK